MPTPDDAAPPDPASAMASSQVQVAAGGQAEGAGFGFRDREPPPSYDGEEPETSFALWERNVRLWEYETDVPRGKRGVKLLRVLSGTARMAVEEMPFEEIACEDGMRNIMSRLREFFQPHLEVSLPRAFEQAVYGQQRQNREGFGEYIARMDRAFNRLKKEGVDLPESAQGYILYRQAALSEAQEQRFLVWSDGRYDRLSAVKALRKLDKVVKEKGKTAYLVDAPENEQVGLFDDAEVDWFEDDGPDAENYVYVQEGDLSEIMDEEDVLSALASYKEIRQAIKDQKKGRGFYGKGATPKGKGKSGGRWQKVHTEQLKMRSRCFKCGQVGHWSKECKSDVKGRSSAPSNQGASVSSVSTSRSGFFVASEPLNRQEGGSAFWLREFIASKAKTQDARSRGEYKGEQSFCGISTCAHHAVVDTAAEGGLIGKPALERLEVKLKERGIKVKWIPKTSAAKGVGGHATCLGVALIPVGIAGVNGLLETTVVDGEVPFLLPIRMLTGLKAVIDLETMKMKLKEYQVEIPMHELASGHVTIDVMEFENGKFVMPMNVPGCVAEDFQVPHSAWAWHEKSLHGAGDMAQSSSKRTNSNPEVFSSPAATNGIFVAESAQEDREPWRLHGGSDGSPNGCGTANTSLKESNSRVAHSPRQAGHVAGLRKSPANRGRVVSTVAALAWLTLGTQGGDIGGRVCGHHCGCEDASASQVKGGSQDSNQQLRSPKGEIEGWGQRFQLLHSVSGLPGTMAESSTCSRDQETAQGEQGVGKERGPLESTASRCGDGVHGRLGDTVPGASSSYAVDGATAGTDSAASEDAVGRTEEEPRNARGATSCTAR